MTVKKFGLKTLRREEWRVQLEKLAKENPLVLHTDAGRTFSMVRRMKAEKKMRIPISLRSGFAISTKNGKAANAMTEDAPCAPSAPRTASTTGQARLPNPIMCSSWSALQKPTAHESQKN